MELFRDNFDPREYDCLADICGNEETTLMTHTQTGKQIIRKKFARINQNMVRHIINVRHSNVVQVLGFEERDTGFYMYEEGAAIFCGKAKRLDRFRRNW